MYYYGVCSDIVRLVEDDEAERRALMAPEDGLAEHGEQLEGYNRDGTRRHHVVRAAEHAQLGGRDKGQPLLDEREPHVAH